MLNEMNVAANSRATPIPDIQGSVIGSLDAASGALFKAGYLPFGENTATTIGRFRFTGRRLDANTASGAQPSGLYYYRARVYAPDLGRFLQPDPIGYAGGLNVYGYVGNDPLNLMDPNGMDVPDPSTGKYSFYVAVHSAGFSHDPFFHGSIWIVNNNTYSGGISTLGGQPALGLTSTSLALTGAPDFPGDLKSVTSQSQMFSIQVPAGQTPSQFASNLTAAAASYQNNQPYSFFPSISPQTAYNSNSFVSGVIRAAGGAAPDIASFSTPGYGRPLPLPSSSIGGKYKEY